MRMTWFLVLATALAVAPATAAPSPGPHWVMIGHHVDGGPVEVDTRSITPWGGLVRGWWRLTLAQPRPDGTAIEKHLDGVDCVRGRQHLAGGGHAARRRQRRSSDARETPSAAITRLGPRRPGRPAIWPTARSAGCARRRKPRHRR